jgi:hypothetical protein
LAALLISEHTPLLGFMEHGYRLEIVIAIASEAVAIVSLGIFLAIADRRAHELRARRVTRDETGNPVSTPTGSEA